ncbi:MAG: SRPBCC domain-containing protein [Flavobacteriales bacterium]|nr:SRPBCC domain-containing protein [Flavobacteriales bacterium]
MAISFTVSVTLNTSTENLYNAWMDGKSHSEMIESVATVENNTGGTFTSHDDYIEGINKELVPFSKIVQSWRSTDSEEVDEDSEITVTFENSDNKTLLTLTHSNLPDHQTAVESGWEKYYFEPMVRYFNS